MITKTTNVEAEFTVPQERGRKRNSMESARKLLWSLFKKKAFGSQYSSTSVQAVSSKHNVVHV